LCIAANVQVSKVLVSYGQHVLSYFSSAEPSAQHVSDPYDLIVLCLAAFVAFAGVKKVLVGFGQQALCWSTSNSLSPALGHTLSCSLDLQVSKVLVSYGQHVL
jgi:hypothetical protein